MLMTMSAIMTTMTITDMIIRVLLVLVLRTIDGCSSGPK